MMKQTINATYNINGYALRQEYIIGGRRVQVVVIIVSLLDTQAVRPIKY
jgi:hypothetical protein